MGGALLKGWLDSRIDATFSVIDPHDIPFTHIDHFRDTAEAAKTLTQTDAVILAVKPQIMAAICEALKEHLPGDALLLSIAAGQSLSTYEHYFGSTQPTIRAMPNTPAAIGKSITVAITNEAVSKDHKALASTLLKTVGKLEWLDDETLMDAVTALSGSGPAYVFYLIEALAKAGIETGLPESLAMKLARQTVIGAAALAETEEQTNAQTLRENVTSPGGTTEAALEVLTDGRIQKLFDEALSAAKKRSRNLNI